MEGRVRYVRRTCNTRIEICRAAGCNDEKFAKKPNARNNSIYYIIVRESEREEKYNLPTVVKSGPLALGSLRP